MKNTTKTKGETRRRSSRGSISDDPVPTKTAKVDDLKKISENLKTELKKTETDKKPEPNNAERKVESLDRRIISLEETEAETRDSARDVTEFQNTCTSIEERLSKINELKKEDNETNKELIVNERIEATLLTTNLKKLNRLTQVRGKIAKEKTQEVKKKVDGLHLDLQNLLYELMHVKKEIQKCMNFSSKDEELDLVDLDKFYEEAPESVSQPAITKENPHQQMLARLDFEMKKRKELNVSKSEFVEQKKKTEVEINQKADYLSNLKPRLEQILKASRPVQEYMNIPFEAEAILQEKAQFLARPLYVLYIQAKAYKEVCDENLEMDIEGDLMEAKSLFFSDDVTEDNDALSDISDTETEAEIDENRGGSSRKHAKKDKERLKEQQNKLLQSHPLKISLTIQEKDAFKVQLTFHHYPALKINAINVQVTLLSKYESFAKSPLLSSQNILQDLCCLDTGKTSPNSANTYQMERLKLSAFENHISKLGLPYFWVQWICGLNYLPNEEITCSLPDAAVSVKHFQKVVRAIKSRVRSRLSLHEQVSSLERLSIREPQSESMKNILPKKRLLSMLSSWTDASYEDLQNFEEHKMLEDLNVVNEDCILYKAAFTRDEVIKVLVVVHTNYPKQSPLLLLSYKDQRNRVNHNADLKCLESEVNSYAEELLEHGHSNDILSNMLLRLQYCFDIFCETGPSSDTKERLYSRKRRGRDRQRPYRYNPDGGYFLQR
ncbi:THO complex subunit 5 homolog [Clytia hemisphaerica]|uniref:THO complex subunit 5 homolog n=1 Tax=Clytia hemisphaerica TaxID=252671 RepID=A0A7M5WKN6_9CNID